jgi:hypothetical protein
MSQFKPGYRKVAWLTTMHAVAREGKTPKSCYQDSFFDQDGETPSISSLLSKIHDPVAIYESAGAPATYFQITATNIRGWGWQRCEDARFDSTPT